MEGDAVTCIASYLSTRTAPRSGIDLAAVPRLDPRLTTGVHQP